MTLPNIVNTGAAGTSALGFTAWGPLSTDGGGNALYEPASPSQHDNAYLRWNQPLNAWVFDVSSASSADTNSSVSQVYYYSSGGQTEASGPVGTYAVGGLGTAPAPVVTINPQVIAGGPAVAVTFATSGSASGPAGVVSPSGTQVSTASVNGSAPRTATQNGWTLTANSDFATGSVQAPSAAAPGTGYTANVGESSGFGQAVFDVVAASAGSPPPPPPPPAPPQKNLTRAQVY